MDDEFDLKCVDLLDGSSWNLRCSPQLSIAETHQRILEAREKILGEQEQHPQIELFYRFLDRHVSGYCGLKNIAHDAIWNAAVHEWKVFYPVRYARKVQQIVLRLENEFLLWTSQENRDHEILREILLRVWDIAGWENASRMVASFFLPHLLHLFHTPMSRSIDSVFPECLGALLKVLCEDGVSVNDIAEHVLNFSKTCRKILQNMPQVDDDVGICLKRILGCLTCFLQKKEALFVMRKGEPLLFIFEIALQCCRSEKSASVIASALSILASWIAALRKLKIIGSNFSIQKARLCFSRAKMHSRDCTADSFVYLAFTDFLEALSRTAFFMLPEGSLSLAEKIDHLISKIEPTLKELPLKTPLQNQKWYVPVAWHI